MVNIVKNTVKYSEKIQCSKVTTVQSIRPGPSIQTQPEKTQNSSEQNKGEKYGQIRQIFRDSVFSQQQSVGVEEVCRANKIPFHSPRRAQCGNKLLQFTNKSGMERESGMRRKKDGQRDEDEANDRAAVEWIIVGPLYILMHN